MYFQHASLKYHDLGEWFLNAGSQTDYLFLEGRNSNSWVSNEAQEPVLLKSDAQVDLDAQPGLEILELNEHLPSPLQLSLSMILCIGTKIPGYCLWYKFFVTDLKLHSDFASSIKAEFSCWLQEELF